MVLLTVTGPPGSGKSTTCRLLRDKTNLTYVYAGQIFRDKATEMGVTLVELGSLCEKDPAYDIELDNRMLDLARNGNAILEGRMIGALCWKERIPAVKVFIDADIEVRAARVQEREGGNIDSIKEGIIERERSERMRYIGLYGLDHLDRNIYDLWIDSTSMSPEEVVQTIIEGAGI